MNKPSCIKYISWNFKIPRFWKSCDSYPCYMYVPFVLFVSLSVKSGEPCKFFSIYLPTNLTYMYVQKSTLPLVIAPFAISFEFLLTLWQIFTKFAIFTKACISEHILIVLVLGISSQLHSYGDRLLEGAWGVGIIRFLWWSCL